MKGWNRKKIVFDLSNRTHKIEEIPEKWLKDFIGGRGLNSRTLYDLIKADTDPLGPDNYLLVGTGPVTGTLAPSSARSTFTALSPLVLLGEGKYPCFGDSNAGGNFGPAIKYAGYDQLVIGGRADSPVYLWIDDGYVEIKSAENLWGKDTYETQDMIKRNWEMRIFR